jgi:hypothetical protein
VRTAAKRDSREAEIISALRAEGYTVFPISDNGIPDLLVSRKGKAAWLLLEVKSPTGTLTKAQERFFQQTEGCPRFMVTNALDALAAARYWLGGGLDS